MLLTYCGNTYGSKQLTQLIVPVTISLLEIKAT